MAIYKNREVIVISANPQFIRTPEMLTVQYKDGTNENVPFNQVRFTKTEKDGLIKAYPSRYESAVVIDDDDLKAVRLGAAPPSDPDLKAQAENQARVKRQQEETRKTNERLQKEADDRIQKELDRPSATPAVTPVHGDSSEADLQKQGIEKPSNFNNQIPNQKAQ